MRLYCSSKCLVGVNNPMKGLTQLKDAGFDSLFLDFKTYMDEIISVEEARVVIEEACKKQNVTCDMVRVQSEKTREALKQGIPLYKVKEQFLDDSVIYMQDRILLKNEYRELHGHLIRGNHTDAVEVAEKIDSLNAEAGFEKYGFCLDVGVCNISGQNMYDFILTLGSRIKAVILRDNDGHSDEALMPFMSVSHGQSNTDWQNLIRGLREIEFDGALILDGSGTLSAFSWMFKPELLHFAKRIMDFFQWQIQMKAVMKKYDMRVLFGAGNMCRNYMKCYGEEFPPLFTCDNNEKRWGEKFEGLEIRNPEELKALPENCAIFICNIYYEQIEKQLRDMGLQNPIERFNDEYMPSFYTDRLEYWQEGKG